jgi:hypothetical protein
LCHIAPGFGSSARRIDGCISGYVTFDATKADEPKTKKDGAIIFCRGPYIPTEQQLIEVFPELKSISERDALFILPETCQENGRITAHMAMIRFYDAAWLIHHHAADASANHRGGLMMLNQISRLSTTLIASAR